MKAYEAIIFGKNKLDGFVENPKFESELFLAYALGIDRFKLLLNKEEEIQQNILNEFTRLIDLRCSGIPYQYIVEKQYFMGMEFYVNKNVLIPRPETEILVEEVLKRIKDNSIILDIGTGSGAIAVSIGKIFDKCSIYAVDVSNAALDVAKINAKKNGVYNKIKFINSDIYKNIPKGLKFDFIVSNPPYIKEKDMNLLQIEVKNEPEIALNGGKDGLNYYRRIIDFAPEYLKKGSFIVFEIGFDQGMDVYDMLKNQGFYDIEIKKDFSKKDRIIIAKF
ncbi:MAG: peptide chain release factor N(5)-glutamine methyltransferase [Thermoanaerobacteraceae bacterium]